MEQELCRRCRVDDLILILDELNGDMSVSLYNQVLDVCDERIVHV